MQSHWVDDGLVQHKAHERRCTQALGWAQPEAGGGRAGKSDCEMETGPALGFLAGIVQQHIWAAPPSCSVGNALNRIGGSPTETWHAASFEA